MAVTSAIFVTVPPCCRVSSLNSTMSRMGFDPVSDYPLGSRRPDLVRTPSGLGLEELTLDAARDGAFGQEELRATPEPLRRQPAVALAGGGTHPADTLARAVGLAGFPGEPTLEIYTPLRPH